MQKECPKQECIKQECSRILNKIAQNVMKKLITQKEMIIMSTDLLRKYDREKITDPLEAPTRKLCLHIMNPLHFNRRININNWLEL